MRESDTIAIIKLLQSHGLLNIKGQYMRDSDTLAGNADNNFLERIVLLNTKGKYMKESNTPAGNATIN